MDNRIVVDASTKMSVDRTRLAYERTLMAWLRTGVSLITFGFTIYKFFDEFTRHSQQFRQRAYSAHAGSASL